MTLRERLIALSVMKNGNWSKMYDSLKNDIQLQSLTEEEVQRSLSKIGDTKAITILDELYPAALKEMVRPPFVLYYQGDLALLEKKKVGVMGNRRPSAYGVESCQSVMNQFLMNEVVIVGGLQLGIDAIAHLLAIRKGKTIALLSSGFLHIYPQENFELYKQIAKNHLVISEYPPHVYPSSGQFYRTHQLLEELSDVMVVLEMVKEDKRLKITQQLIDDGKIIYSLPTAYNSVHGEGNLLLLKRGAYCLTHSSDVFDTLNWIKSEN